MSVCKLFNMCMVYDSKNNKVLVQDKIPDDGWGGITFPGGHIEPNESFIDSAIREVKEETGLTIYNLEYCGIINYFNTETEERWLCFLYKTCDYTGNLLDADETIEGNVFWIYLDELKNLELAPNMTTYLELFFNPRHHEAFSKWSSLAVEPLKIM